MFDEKFILCFDVGKKKFLLEYEMFMPRAHLRKGALRPRCFCYCYFGHGMLL